jgi:outer membrane protein TolC
VPDQSRAIFSSPLTVFALCCLSAMARAEQPAPPDTIPPAKLATPGAVKANSAAQSPGAAPQPAQATSAQSAIPAGVNLQALSIANAVSLGRSRSFLSQQYDARVAGAAARLTGASKLMNPVASIAGHVGHDAAGTDEDYILSQTFELGDKRRQRVLAATAERDAAAFDRAAALNDLAFTIKSAYFEARRADAAQALAQSALDNARKFAEAAQLQFTAGDVPRTQVTRSKIEQNRAGQALAAAETDRANRYATLRSLIHVPEPAGFGLSDSLGFAPVDYHLENLLAFALSHRPDLQSAAKVRAGKEAQLHGARAQSQPDLFIEGRHANIDPAQGGDTLRIGLLFPLIDFGRNRADAFSARSAVTEQDAVIAETRRIALLEVETAFRNLQQARQAVESFQSGRLDNSKELVDLAQIGYSQGANTFLELLDAQQVYRSEQTDYTRALADYNIALATLERAVGGTLP